MKDVMVKIVGTQYNEGQEESVEFVTEGRLYKKNDAFYLIYKEGEMTGLGECITTLKARDENVKIIRRGEILPADTHIEFEEGRPYEGYYATPYGTVEMKVVTNKVTNALTEEGGHLSIDYHMCLTGLSEGRSVLDINIL